jgi:hypothetical protein
MPLENGSTLRQQLLSEAAPRVSKHSRSHALTCFHNNRNTISTDTRQHWKINTHSSITLHMHKSSKIKQRERGKERERECVRVCVYLFFHLSIFFLTWRPLATKVGMSKAGESNGKLPLRTCPECSVPEPNRSPDWGPVAAKTGPRAKYYY